MGRWAQFGVVGHGKEADPMTVLGTLRCPSLRSSQPTEREKGGGCGERVRGKVVGLLASKVRSGLHKNPVHRSYPVSKSVAKHFSKTGFQLLIQARIVLVLHVSMRLLMSGSIK